jgi:peptide/histidine transporter 3/4
LGIACVIVILAAFSLLAFIIGLAGYQANFIQLGLDQLFEAPSQYLVLFIYYATWAFNFGALQFIINLYAVACIHDERKFALVIIQVLVPFLLTVSLLISCWKRRWFLSEPGYQNPYKVVYGVFKFAKSHKHPLRRSAFTHCDNYIPSRLDFAKERFGGPFTTEQVENVKTFMRILVVLFAVGPVFALEVPATYFIAPLFAMHFHHYDGNRQEYCKDMIPLEYLVEITGVLVLPSLILFPVCSLILFSLLRKKLQRLFTRLGVGILFCFLGVLCLLLTDIVGHVQQNVTNHTQCVFHITLSYHKKLVVDSLNMHWAVLIPPYLFLGIGPLMVIATTLEFISAQSPQSMKGLLVGVFFAIRGLFQFLNSIIIIPLSLRQPWASREMIEHPPVTNCGFVYLALTSVTGLIGLILFSLAAKRYKYRTRDEGMFRQHDVEEIYDRYIDQRESEGYSYDSIDG